MGKLFRPALLISAVLLASSAFAHCPPETEDMSCGMECVPLWGDGWCAITTTSQTSACFTLVGGCMSHPNDCRCGGDGGF